MCPDGKCLRPALVALSKSSMARRTAWPFGWRLLWEVGIACGIDDGWEGLSMVGVLRLFVSQRGASLLDVADRHVATCQSMAGSCGGSASSVVCKRFCSLSLRKMLVYPCSRTGLPFWRGIAACLRARILQRCSEFKRISARNTNSLEICC